jgi:hypothetical protein
MPEKQDFDALVLNASVEHWEGEIEMLQQMMSDGEVADPDRKMWEEELQVAKDNLADAVKHLGKRDD